MKDHREAVLRRVDDTRDEIVDFAAELVRIPTVNPPGELYRECAQAIGNKLGPCGFEVQYLTAEDRPEHTPEYPRMNVLGLQRGRSDHPLVHLNGHTDVVPAGQGWTVDPFGGLVRDGRLYGRGSTDMKAGIAAAVYAAAALGRAGVQLEGSVEVSGTVDEESGGFAGMAWLAETKRIARGRTDYVIIPEPLNVDRICIGHRGVYWFKVSAQGKAAHGSMPFLGVSAIEQIGAVLESVRNELAPALAERTTEMPVVPPRARRASININAIRGGQAGQDIQSPCVADRCEAIFDRRLLVEEDIEQARREIIELLDKLSRNNPNWHYELTDLMTVHPVRTPDDSPLIASLTRSIDQVLGRKPELIASPGTYDHKHVKGIAGVEHCVAYGPGILELAHQADEYCLIEDLIHSTKVLALTILELTGTR